MFLQRHLEASSFNPKIVMVVGGGGWVLLKVSLVFCFGPNWTFVLCTQNWTKLNNNSNKSGLYSCLENHLQCIRAVCALSSDQIGYSSSINKVFTQTHQLLKGRSFSLCLAAPSCLLYTEAVFILWQLS